MFQNYFFFQRRNRKTAASNFIYAFFNSPWKHFVANITFNFTPKCSNKRTPNFSRCYFNNIPSARGWWFPRAAGYSCNYGLNARGQSTCAKFKSVCSSDCQWIKNAALVVLSALRNYLNPFTRNRIRTKHKIRLSRQSNFYGSDEKEKRNRDLQLCYSDPGIVTTHQYTRPFEFCWKWLSEAKLKQEASIYV